MRKNYILALLATGVLPLSAFGAIEIGIPDVSKDLDKWNISGVSDEVQIENGIVTLPGSQSGYPAYTIANLPAGKYKITGTLDNAKFVVKVGENEVAINEDGTFETTVSGNLVIEIKAKNMAAAFSFGNIELTLEEDLTTIQNELKDLIKDALMPATELTAPVDEMEEYETSEINGQDVIAEYKELVEEGEALNKKIDALTATTDKSELEVYTQYKAEDLKGQVRAYAEKVAEYQHGIEIAPDKYSKYPIGTLNQWAIQSLNNKADWEANLNEIDSTSKTKPGWQKKLDDLVAEISEENLATLDAKIKEVQAKINATRNQINYNYEEAEGVKEGKEPYEKVLMTAIEAAYNDLDDADSALKNGKDNYEKWLRKYQELTNAYINAQQVIKDIYEGEDGYKERVDSVMAAVTAIYNDAISGNKDKGIEKLDVEFGAGSCTGEDYTHDRDLIDEAIKKLAARTDEDITNLNNEKAALELGKGKVDALTDSLEDVQNTLEDYAYRYPELEAQGEALAEKIEALETELNDVYASTQVLTDAYVNDTTSVDKDGNPTGFGSKVDEVQAEIDTLNAQIAKANPLGYLTKALEDAKTEIEEDDNNKYLAKEASQYNINVLGIMNGSYKSITAAIEQQQGIYDEDYSKVKDADLESILVSIQGDETNTDCYLSNGLKLAAAFADAFKQIIPAKKEADLLVDFIDQNTIKFNVSITTTLEDQDGYNKENLVDTNDYETAADEYQTFANDTIDKLVKACDLAPQNAYDEVVKVSGESEVQNLYANVINEKVEYLQAVMNALSTVKYYNNFTELDLAINTYLADQIAGIDAGEYPGFEDLDNLFAEVQAAFEDLQSNYAKALNGSATPEPEPQLLSEEAPEITPEDPEVTPEDPEVTPEEVVSVDQQLININDAARELINEIQKVQNLIDKVVKNQKAYEKVVDLVNQIKAKKDEALQYAEDAAYDPAVGTWQDMVDANVADAEGKLDDVTPIYNAVKMLEDYEEGTTNADYYIGELDNILTWFKNFKVLVDANEQAHDNLLDKSASVTRLVDDVNNFITKGGVDIIVTIDGEDQNAADVLSDYADELSALDTELYKAYKTVSCKGQDLEGTEEEPTLMDKYNALYAKINDLKASLDDPFAQALKAANEEFIEKNWKSIQNKLLKQYHMDLDDLQAYKDEVDTCSALEEDPEIQTAIDHQPIYDYAEQIQKLIAGVENLLETSWPSQINGEENLNQHKLTEKDLDKFIQDANSIESGLGDTYGQKVDAITKAAQTVFNNKYSEFSRNFAEVFKTLEDKGCDAASISAALKDATKALELADIVKDTQQEIPSAEYVGDIAKAINALDDVKITDADMQNAAVLTFNTAADKVEKAIDAAQTHLNNVTLPSKTALQERINQAYADLNELKAEETTLDNLKTKLGALDVINVADIDDAIDKAVTDNQTNIENKAALDAKVSDLQKNLDALNTWVEKLLVAGNLNYNLQSQIDNVKISIEQAYKASENLSDDQVMSQLEGTIAGIQKAIDKAYTDAYTLEYKRLQDTELQEVERAFNEEAKKYEAATGNTNYPDTDEGKALANSIDKQRNALVTACLGVGLVPTEEQQDAIVGIQNALLDIQLELGYLTADDVIAVLNEAAENAIDTINASKDAINGTYAEEELAPKYDALVADVEALQAQWVADKSGAIVKESVYVRDINKIVKDDLKALNDEAKELNATGAAHEASNAAYVELNGQLDEVRQAWEEAQTNAEKYAFRLTAAQYYEVNNYLTNADNAIGEAQSELDAAKDAFTCADFEWGNTLTNINQDITNANTPLWEGVTNSYLVAATKAYYNAFDALNNGKNHSNAEGFAASLRKLKSRLDKLEVVENGDVEKGEMFVTEAEDIISNAEALFKAILDAEYTAGDITGTGEITTDDYEALIELLGELDDPEDFDNPAYDVNGDGQVTMADIASIIDILMGRESNAAVMARMPMVNTNNAIFVVKTSTNNGISRYALILNNTAELFGAQMDIVLGDGMEIVNEGVAERTSGHEFYGSTTNSGKHRIILSSIGMDTFVGSEGAIVYIDVRGEGELNLDNVLGVDTAGRMYNINVMTNVTGIESISTDGKNADIYNVAGQKLGRTQRGAVNIIRTADGKTSKIIKK